MTHKPYTETALTMMARECRAIEPDHFFFAPLSPANLRGLVLRRLDRRVRNVTPAMKEQSQDRCNYETRGYCEQTVRAFWQRTSPWHLRYAPKHRAARVPAHDNPVWDRVAKRLA